MHFVRIFLALGLVLPVVSLAQEITAVYPARTVPGGSVTITGGPFGEDALVVLGDQAVEPKDRQTDKLVFTVPALLEGEYTLLVQEGESVSAGTHTLTVIEPTPRIISLDPRNLETCSLDPDHRVVAEIHHVLPGASLLLDSKILPHERIDQGRLAFRPPSLAAGIYGIQVVNPGGARSLPQSLWVNDIPKIDSVTQGEDFVSYYQLIITGKNFFPNSALVVTESAIGFSDTPPQQNFIFSKAPSTARGFQRIGDHTVYVDCATLIYNRYPYSSQPKDLTLLIVNPDGKRTANHHLSAP
ncbi:MAG: hypothetical protein C0617_05165 [Desulfuromonas sp.]|uniref:IPT/TIG domain-containing protein n=1 Tax=Desulfuromonas sp. TaxID=892 RepID=UPI000CB6674F|nr:IPT/TIG domain-containing protein [Desulfuromonas sp.]PLX85081.1 MAG: hypothetical protein C0617_05165 [Desulfuromonas sp.]